MLGVGHAGPLGTDRQGQVPTDSGRPADEAAGDAGRRGVEARGRAGRRSEREALAVLATVDGLGPVTLARLVDRLGDACAVLESARGRGGEAALRGLALDDGDPPRRLVGPVASRIVDAARTADAVLAGLDAAGLSFVTLADADYPSRLLAIELPPHTLFVRGDPGALAAPRAVAVVGTRRPSEAGRLVAARIAGALARAGAAVVSGLAIGIDGAAHAAAVAEGGLTVAVLGSGHARLYPLAHRRLADAIVAGGGVVVSEFAPDVRATQGTFPRRNRLISGLAEATVVVEAGARSGSLITAGWALEQGRECFLVPGPIDSRTAAGCLSFLREFSGQARIVAGVPQLLEDLNLAGSHGDPRAAALSAPVAAILIELGDGARRVAAELVRGRTTADELVATTEMPIAAVLGALTLLESRGLVAGAYGRYRPIGRLATEPVAARR